MSCVALRFSYTSETDPDQSQTTLGQVFVSTFSYLKISRGILVVCCFFIFWWNNHLMLNLWRLEAVFSASVLLCLH